MPPTEHHRDERRENSSDNGPKGGQPGISPNGQTNWKPRKRVAEFGIKVGRLFLGTFEITASSEDETQLFKTARTALWAIALIAIAWVIFR